jgi:PncC family amidohydrolase
MLAGICGIITVELMDEESLEAQIGEALRQRGWRLATAESCTGGLLGDHLTNVPGSSTYYVGGVVAYAYDAKVRILSVSWETLERYGAVSEEVVLEMAREVRRAMAADVGVSISGIAGPGGGTPEKPVGLIWIGLSTPDGDWARRMMGQGDRLENKREAAEGALQMLHEYLKEGKV